MQFIITRLLYVVHVEHSILSSIAFMCASHLDSFFTLSIFISCNFAKLGTIM